MARAERDRAEGKSPSTQAGEFVREEIHHIREGKHGARSTKQAIAIGLSKARRAGVALGTPKNGNNNIRRKASQDLARGRHNGNGSGVSRKRSRSTLKALKREGRNAAASTSLSRQAASSAHRRTAASRSAAARKAARTRRSNT